MFGKFQIFISVLFRSLSSVLGFSKETLIAVVTKIEGREWHRQDCASKNRPLEHPRASSTDDMECFFSLIRDSIGQNFMIKEAKLGIHKFVGKFSKQADPALPFIIIHHHTLSIMKALTLTLTKQLKERQRRNVSLEENNPLYLLHGVQLCQLGAAYQLGPHFTMCHWSYFLLLMDLCLYLNMAVAIDTNLLVVIRATNLLLTPIQSRDYKLFTS